MKKLSIIWLALLCCNSLWAQLSGSFESNAAYYTDDKKIKLDFVESQNRLRSNNYLRLDYKLKNLTAGVQLEAYEGKALLNYSPTLNKTNIATYYVNYKNDSIGIDITVGHFYEQFGSGLALRTWEDRQLGVANSIVGARVKYSPLQEVSLTALYGKQRDGLGFSFTEGSIGGLNSDINLSQIFKSKKVVYGIGGSYVEKTEPSNNNIIGNKVYLSSARANLSYRGFSADIEYAFKSQDALVEFGVVRPNLPFDGDAYLLNLAYTKKGFGINGSFRRLENFAAYSQRNLAANVYNRALLNYIPALTKQYDYSLTNIYVYAAQPNIAFDPGRNKAGEVGGQIDAFYNFKKETVLGGKYGTSVSVNFAEWHGLAGRYLAAERKYKANFIELGQKYYRDAGLEIRKKWTPKWSSILTYVNQFYNAKYVEEATGQVNTHTLVIENTVRLKKQSAVKWQLQHQWADALYKNWAAAQLEYNFNTKWSAFAVDLFNYGNDENSKKIHFYNMGLAYKKGSGRVQASYGRQRGGLICVGGVCRFVPESVGPNLSLVYSF